MQLYGKSWTRRELEARVGRLEQVGGIRRFQLTEGKERWMDQIQIRTGAGLTYYITPDKGMDISLAEFCGVPISWQSPNGDVHPSYYAAEGNEWLRTASGGLLMTCGLTQVGSACSDEGGNLGLHGRIHHTPANRVSAVGRWVQDEYEMTVSGSVEETSIFGDCLLLDRKLTSKLGCNSIGIEDEVRNIGFRTSPHMMLYHFNFGFPLLSESSEIMIQGSDPEPREKETPVEGYDSWQAPDPDYQERVYYHRGEPRCVEIYNPKFPVAPTGIPLRVRLQWSNDTLPELVQWKMPGACNHVLGIEPANCRVEGRGAERKRGTLVLLEPGQSLYYKLVLNFI